MGRMVSGTNGLHMVRIAHGTKSPDTMEVIEQFADKLTRGQPSRGLVYLRTSQLSEMFDGKFGV